MANRPAKVTETEVTRAIKGVAKAGIEIGEVRVNAVTGEVTIFSKDAARNTHGKQGAAYLDEMLGIQ
ncbi:hypothetical protein D1822_12645 [Phaeobacter inhibens]|uniref:hypothetical protein n=1 Tax=Phaeobacter inhibens TaxID=221822 RepID=UPI0001632BD8|nr:hypothetical protein [Phaeobacter inhibens]AFO92253.1 hypothetical protein PGA1_c25850 [Phaeobacter inhibens DSM 17395]AUQ46942.1 hypothetical protein PhaeoP10_02622 [Phaeobacter inhibens]AUQ55163.1 hypothetical protein PhaeoP92_02509 [Phaeobacter inhibens]AUQ79179.1 hypothetical protein PhaeoP74_02510 [Phaeobacter inhibens]AUR16338.1 hypothetical protein PhaeoP70_02508 [Phaeobacter inhibens]